MTVNEPLPKPAPTAPLVMPWAADHSRAIIVAGTILSALLLMSTVGILAAFLAGGSR